MINRLNPIGLLTILTTATLATAAAADRPFRPPAVPLAANERVTNLNVEDSPGLDEKRLARVE